MTLDMLFKSHLMYDKNENEPSNSAHNDFELSINKQFDIDLHRQQKTRASFENRYNTDEHINELDNENNDNNNNEVEKEKEKKKFTMTC